MSRTRDAAAVGLHRAVQVAPMAFADAGHLDPGRRRIDRGPTRADRPQLLGALDLAEGEQQPGRDPAQGVRLGGIGRGALGRLDELERIVDGAGPKQLERHAARVEHARVAPAAVAQPAQLRLEEDEADDVLEVVVEDLGQDVRRSTLQVAEVARRDLRAGAVGCALDSEHAGLDVGQPGAAERPPEEPPGIGQEVVVGVGQRRLLAEEAVNRETGGEHRHVERAAVVRDEARERREVRGDRAQERRLVREVGEQVLAHGHPRRRPIGRWPP